MVCRAYCHRRFWTNVSRHELVLKRVLSAAIKPLVQHHQMAWLYNLFLISTPVNFFCFCFFCFSWETEKQDNSIQPRGYSIVKYNRPEEAHLGAVTQSSKSRGNSTRTLHLYSSRTNKTTKHVRGIQCKPYGPQRLRPAEPSTARGHWSTLTSGRSWFTYQHYSAICLHSWSIFPKSYITRPGECCKRRRRGCRTHWWARDLRSAFSEIISYDEKKMWLICFGYRPHLLNRRSWTSADVRLPLGCQSPWYTHCSFAKHRRNKRCHGFDHAHHNPLFACHCHWSWRPRSSRASPSTSIQGRCEDQGRNTQHSGSSNSPVIRQREGGCCLGECHPHGSLEEDARRLPLTIELTHSLKYYSSSVWAD